MDKHVLLEKLRGFEEDSIWINKHYNDLKVKYPNEWVAVFHGKVIDHNHNLKELMEKLKRKYPKDIGDIAVELVSPEEVELIL